MDREVLERLAETPLTQREIAEKLGVSRRTTGKWMRRYGIKTYRRRIIESGEKHIERHCRVHGETTWRRDGKKYTCIACHSGYIKRKRAQNKQALIDYLGGRCQQCGYNRYIGALEFHHRDPNAKAFGLSESNFARPLASLKIEADKCDLLCANCHREVENGLDTGEGVEPSSRVLQTRR